MIGLRAGPLGLAGWCLLAWVSFWRPLSADSQLFLSDDVYFVIWTMDAGSGDIVRGFSAPRDAIGITVPRGRSGLALDGGEVFYTHSSSDQIYVLDSFSGEVRRTLPKPSTDISGLDAGGGKLFAVTSSRTGAAVYQLDPSTGAVLNQKLLPGARDALAYSAARGSLFVRIGSLEIREIDAQTGASRRSLSPPAEFSGLAFSDVTGLLYGMTEEGALYDLNPDTGAVTRKLQVKDSSGNELRQCGGLAAGQVAPPPGAGPQQARSRSLDSRLRVSDATLMPGEVQAVPILLSTAREAQGFSVALIHDPGILALDGITVGSTATSQFQADFVPKALEFLAR